MTIQQQSQKQISGVQVGPVLPVRQVTPPRGEQVDFPQEMWEKLNAEWLGGKRSKTGRERTDCFWRCCKHKKSWKKRIEHYVQKHLTDTVICLEYLCTKSIAGNQKAVLVLKIEPKVSVYCKSTGHWGGQCPRAGSGAAMDKQDPKMVKGGK